MDDPRRTVYRDAPGMVHAPWSRVRRELFGLGIVALGLTALFGRYFVPGIVGQQRDTGAFYFPLTHWFAQELQAGRFPLWCPLIFGGYPLFADGEIGMLYPLNLVALIALPIEPAFFLIRTAHYFIAGIGTYALARLLGIGRLSAAYGGLAFALGAFMIGHLDHANILRTAAWFPFMLCCGELTLRGSSRRAFAWTACLATLLTLAGLGVHPQILLIELVGLWVYLPIRAAMLATGAGRFARPDGSHNRDHSVGGLLATSGRVLCRLVIVLLLGTTLGLAGAAAQLIPMYELGQLSARGARVAYWHSSAGALSPFDLVTLLQPFVFRGDPRNVWSLFPYWETTLYIGVVGVILVPCGLLAAGRRTVAPVVALGATGLAVAMAAYFPVDIYAWLWSIPGFSSMRMPARYSLLVELPLAILAAFGLDWWVRAAGSSRGRRVAAALLATALAILATTFLIRLWLVADEAGSIEWLRSTYLSLPRDRPTLSVEQVRTGLLSAFHLSDRWTLLSIVAALAALLVIFAWNHRPAASRRWRLGLLGISAAELIVVAHAFHPTTPVETLAEPSRALQFLSTRPGLWRTFLAGRTDAAITSRPALVGVAQAFGYSSLPSMRSERYWERVNQVDDELLDLWNSRYVVEPKGAPGRIWAQDVLFDPTRPLLFGPANSPVGHESFRLSPTATDTIRVLSMAEGVADLPDGTPVAELVVWSADTTSETLLLSLGSHTAEAAYDDPHWLFETRTAPIHSRPRVGYRWDARDGTRRVYPRNVYVADLALGQRRLVERVEVRAIAPTGDFRLAGLALRDAASGGNGSLLPHHRDKYSLAFEDERTMIFENRAAMPRAFVVGESVTAGTDEWSLVYLLRRGFDPRRQVLLESSQAPAYVERRGITPTANASAVFESYAPNEVVIRATSPGPAHLVLVDTFYPGWRAWVNGREAHIERADYLFRAVAIPSGEHVVKLRFEPPSLMLGGLVSAAASAAIVALAVIGVHPRARRRTVKAPEPATVAHYPSV